MIDEDKVSHVMILIDFDGHIGQGLGILLHYELFIVDDQHCCNIQMFTMLFLYVSRHKKHESVNW